jgi:hypothetical protein
MYMYVIDVHDTLLQAMLQHTALLVMLYHCIVTYHFQDGHWNFFYIYMYDVPGLHRQNYPLQILYKTNNTNPIFDSVKIPI